jgi:serine/threonine-protein kinase BUR1
MSENSDLLELDIFQGSSSEQEEGEQVDKKRKRDDIGSESDSDFEELPMPPRAPQLVYAEDEQNAAINTNLNSAEVEVQPEVQEFELQQVPQSPPTSPIRHFYGCSPISNYTIQKKIGEGTFGEVSLARHKSGKLVALKRILVHVEKEGMPITALREIRILKRLSHPNIIRLVEMAVKPGMHEIDC